jgi:hypothetical protein
VWSACRHAGPLVLLTPLVALGWIVLNTFGMSVLVDGKVPFGQLLHNRLVGDGYNMLLPLAGLGGEPWKLRHLSTFVPTPVAVAALIRDRVIENAVGFVVTAIVVAIGIGHYPLPRPLHTALFAYVFVALACAVLSSALVVTHLPGKAGTLVAKLLGVGGADSGPPPGPLPLARFARVAFWNFLGRIVGSVEVAVLLYALTSGFDAARTVFIDCVNNAAGFIGFVIPQGLGVNEGTTVYLLGALGYAGAIAVAFALVRRGRMLVVSLLGVLLHLLRRRSTTPAR